MAKTGVGIKLLMTTTALSVAIGSFSPLPLTAQEATPGTMAPAVEPTTPVAPVIEPEITPAPEEQAPEAASPSPEPETAPEEAAPTAPPVEAPEAAPEAATESPAAPPAEAPAEEPSAEPGADDSAPTPPETSQSAPQEEDAQPEVSTPDAAPSSSATPEVAPEQSNEVPGAAPSPTPEPEVTPEAETDEPTATPEAVETEAPAPDTAVEASDTAKEPTEQAVESLKDLLGGAATAVGAVAATQASGDAAATTETTTQVKDTDARSSSEDFATTASGERRDNKDDDDGLSNLQKVGLLALGGLAVGALLNNGDEVVSNTGDRVVVQQDDGNYVVLKDDDALLRQPGSTVRTENFTDGSTRSTVDYADGTRVVTVRDASGRVLRRDRVVDGTEIRLIDDTAQVAPVDVSLLPRGRDDILVPTNDRAALRDALARIETRDNARGYSLAQIRDYRQVRALAPVVDVDNITFATGSAAVTASQAENLSDLGTLLRDLITERPNEIFLVEGHTDAVGSAASNLALSDRRAESVALALTEYFDVPPENLVVQGYGESDLRVESDADEPRNRRVAVRIVTPILQTAQR